MWLVPYTNLLFTSSVETDELINFIREQTAPWQTISFLSSEKKTYFSSFLGHRFTLKENAFPIFFPSILTGNISSYSFDTKIKVTIEPGWFMLLCVFFLLSWLGLSLYFFVIAHEFDMPDWKNIVAPAALYILLLIIFRYKVAQHRKRLIVLLKAETPK